MIRKKSPSESSRPSLAKYLSTLASPERFLNVDLEIFSRSELETLVTIWGNRVHTLYLGKEFGFHKATLELAAQPKSPDAAILGFCKLIHSLSPRELACWDSAKARTFDIGIEVPDKGRTYWAPITAAAVHAAAEVGARIAISIYGPMKTLRSKRRLTTS